MSLAKTVKPDGGLSPDAVRGLSALGLTHTLAGHDPTLSDRELISMAAMNKKGSGKRVSYLTLPAAVDAAYLFFDDSRETTFQELAVPPSWAIGYRCMAVTHENEPRCALKIKDTNLGVSRVEVTTACVAFTKGKNIKDRKIKTLFPFAESSGTILPL